MKKILLITVAATMLFSACGNNNTKKEQKQEEPVAQEAVVEEPAAPETTTWDHYDWLLVMPSEGWKVQNAYSDMGLEKLGEYKYIDLKDWSETTLEKCFEAQGCRAENKLDDVVVGDYTWNVFSKTDKYDLAAYTINAADGRVIRVGTNSYESVNDPDFMTVLQGFSFK